MKPDHFIPGRQGKLKSNPRAAAACALSQAVMNRFDVEMANVETQGLSDRDAGLALAIYRGAVQRYLTLEYLLNRHLSQPMHRLEPMMKGLLLSAGAQLLLMDRVPAYAVVDETVELAGKMIRRGAGGMVNAVLRRMAELVDRRSMEERWTPGVNRLPLLGNAWEEVTDGEASGGKNGGVLWLKEGCLPGVGDKVEHLGVALSQPRALVERWLSLFGEQRVMELGLHGLQVPPVIVAVEDGLGEGSGLADGEMSGGQGGGTSGETSGGWVAHERKGFVVWRGTHEGLRGFLGGRADRRVQDPASAQPVLLTKGLKPKVILDYCAGRGTKTRQLARMHPQAQVIAWEPDMKRRGLLREVIGVCPNVEVVEPGGLAKVLGTRKVDLLVLDVPCSNTAVLARRPEARYRYRGLMLDRLVVLQREIVQQARGYLAEQGYVLYSTCSLDPAENQQQKQWMMTHQKWSLVEEMKWEPAGVDRNYQDGCYAVVLRAG